METDSMAETATAIKPSPSVFPRRNSEAFEREPPLIVEEASNVKASYSRPIDRPFTSNQSSTRLNDIGFDPISRMVDLYDEVSIEILEMEWIRDNQAKTKKRYSVIAHASLLTLKQKLINDLLRFGYSRVNENVTPVGTQRPGLTITLSNGVSDYQIPQLDDNGVT